MSQLFDLNVNNYSLKELLNFFGVDKNDDAASVDRSCNDLKKKIQADPKLGPVTKGKIHDFLNKAVDRLSQSRNATKELFESSSGGSGSSGGSSSGSSSSGSDGLTAATITAAIKASAPAPGPTQFMQLKNDVQEHGDNFLITRPSEQLGIAGNFKNGKTALTGAPPGIVNPVAMATIKRALNVDTRFRSNYYSSKSTDFVFNIPYKFENVTSMSVATYELPLTYYAISQEYENNCIVFQWKFLGAENYNQYTLLLPDGNYNASFQSGNGSPIESAINGILKGTSLVQQTGLAYTVDRTSGRSIFACNSATDANGNVLPYDPNSSSTFDMTTPCLTQTLHMSTSAYAPDVLHANMTVPSLDTLVVNTFASLSSSSSTLPIPEVILANHSEESGPGTGGVGLLIGFPSEYSIVSSVTITNVSTNTSYTITGPPTLTGYYVFYENNYSSPGFWPDLSNPPYANVVQVQQNSGMCGGLVFGNNSLTFTYVISGVSTTLTYTTPSGFNIGDGKQYQQYNGQPPFNPPADFQWGGSGGTESWGTQIGTGTQTYAQWQASGSYQFNSIYKFLYPYSTSSSPSPTNGAFVIWTDPVQACATTLYFSLNDSCGDPINLLPYANSTLSITDGTNTQTFHVSNVVNSGSHWTVTVSDGVGFNIANGAQIQATFTNPALTSPPSPFPTSGAIIWNDLTQACATTLYFSPNDSCGPINLSPYANSTLSITDGTNVQTFNVSSVVNTGPGNYWNVSVSNGTGFNIANGAQVQATFTNPPPTTPPSPFPNGQIIWNNSIQSISTKIYFSANDANGNPVDLSGFDANKLSITDGVITQTFDVSAVNSSGSPIVYWEVDVSNGLGPNMPVNVPVEATFTRPVPTGPPTASGVPSGNVWWNDVVQAFSTILYFSVDDSLSPPGNVDLSTFQNSKLTITDGTNTQTFSVSSITDAGLGSNNYWTVNVSNGAGLNMANCADIKATFTTTNVHTPFTGSMRIVFNVRAGIDRNVESSVVNSSFQSDTRPLPLFLGWQLGYRTAIYELGGGVDGIPQSAVSEGVCLITGPQYVFLCIDDYNNNVNNYYASAYGSSTIAPNIIARLNIKQQINSAGAYGVVSGESLSTSLTYSREYFGPVDIQRIRITLVDDFGRVLDLNNMDWSFALMFECVYSSSMA